MKQSTIKKYTEILLSAKQSNKNLSEFCASSGISYNSITSTIFSLKHQVDSDTEEIRNLISLYNEVVSRGRRVTKENLKAVEKIDTDDRAETAYIRGEDNKIKFYSYQIYRKNKSALSGKLTREEMNAIHRLYSYYGDSLTQRIVSRHFVDLSLVDFKRILRAFNITKASAPFAPHMIEEYSEEELREIQLREKENSFLRKAEEDQIKNNEKLLKKYAQENIALKKELQNCSFSINVSNEVQPTTLNKVESTGRDINIYLADLHLGASLTSGALYNENEHYGYDEAKRRLLEVLNRLQILGSFDTVNIVLMGDNVDCAGFFGRTARLDHYMPENMDVREQANGFIDLITWFVSTIVNPDNHMCSSMNVYSVPCGNHGGNFEYMCNKALMATLNVRFPEIKTVTWENFFGIFQHKNDTFVCCHGKDDQYMKKGLPLNLDAKSKVMLYEWLHDNNIHSDNVHFIKGDLHSNSLNSCKRLDYRNVLSLFGASDYANYNFSRNAYGVSYDLFIGDNLIRGTFENL